MSTPTTQTTQTEVNSFIPLSTVQLPEASQSGNLGTLKVDVLNNTLNPSDQPTQEDASQTAEKTGTLKDRIQQGAQQLQNGVKTAANTVKEAIEPTVNYLTNPVANMQANKQVTAHAESLLERAVVTALKPRLMANGLFGIETKSQTSLRQQLDAILGSEDLTEISTLINQLPLGIRREIETLEEESEALFYKEEYKAAVQSIRDKYATHEGLAASVVSLAEEEFFTHAADEGKVTRVLKNTGNYLRNSVRIGTVIADDTSRKFADITFTVLNSLLSIPLRGLGTAIALVVAYVVRCVAFIATMAFALLVNGLQTAAVIAGATPIVVIGGMALLPSLIAKAIQEIYNRVIGFAKEIVALINQPSRLEILEAKVALLQEENKALKQHALEIEGTAPTDDNLIASANDAINPFAAGTDFAATYVPFSNPNDNSPFAPAPTQTQPDNNTEEDLDPINY